MGVEIDRWQEEAAEPEQPRNPYRANKALGGRVVSLVVTEFCSGLRESWTTRIKTA